MAPKCSELSPGMQDLDASVVRRITEEISQFTKDWLGFTPILTDVDYHQQAIAVTMAGILAEAEKNALKYQGMSELIIKNHTSAYKSVRHILETRIAGCSGKSVAGSALMMDSESNCATILIKFE